MNDKNGDKAHTHTGNGIKGFKDKPVVIVVSLLGAAGTIVLMLTTFMSYLSQAFETIDFLREEIVTVENQLIETQAQNSELKKLVETLLEVGDRQHGVTQERLREIIDEGKTLEEGQEDMKERIAEAEHELRVLEILIKQDVRSADD